MTRLDHSIASDDGFDPINAADSASNTSINEPQEQTTPSVYQDVDRGRLEGPRVPYETKSSHCDVAFASPSSSPNFSGPQHPSGHDAYNHSTFDNDKSGGRLGDGIAGIHTAFKAMIRQNMWKKDDVLIAVMGMTGSGKTTFISKVTRRNDLEIGHNLSSCTQDVQAFETKINGQTVRFVDTPGFSDTSLSDTEVLQLIADYLAKAYKEEMKLSGIIYLHPISDRRFTHHGNKNLEMFQKLTGEKNLKNVILATSMWDNVTPKEGSWREKELQKKHWQKLLVLGAKYERHTGGVKSARRVASQLMTNEPFYLKLQEEMGQGNMALRDTEAGREVMIEIIRMKEQHQKELSDLWSRVKNSAEERKSVIEALKELYEDQIQELEKTLSDERKMNEEAVKSMNDRINALEKRGGGCAVM